MTDTPIKLTGSPEPFFDPDGIPLEYLEELCGGGENLIPGDDHISPLKRTSTPRSVVDLTHLIDTPEDTERAPKKEPRHQIKRLFPRARRALFKQTSARRALFKKTKFDNTRTRKFIIKKGSVVIRSDNSRFKVGQLERMKEFCTIAWSQQEPNAACQVLKKRSNGLWKVKWYQGGVTDNLNPRILHPTYEVACFSKGIYNMDGNEVRIPMNELVIIDGWGPQPLFMFARKL